MSLDIAQIDTDSVDAINYLLGSAQSSTFNESGNDFNWCWRNKFLSSDLPSMGIRLEAEGKRVIYWPVWNPPSSLVVDIDLSAFEGSAKLLAATLRYSTFLDHFSRMSGQSWLPTELVTSGSSDTVVQSSDAVGFHIYGTRKELLHQGQLTFEAQSLNFVHQIQGVACERASVIQHIPLKIFVALSGVTIPANDIKRLVANSAIVVGNCRSAKIPVRLHSACGQYATCAFLEGDQVTVEDYFKPQLYESIDIKEGLTMNTLHDEATGASDMVQPVKVNNIPVELSFEIGRLTITLGELETVLHSGYTFNLNQELKTNSVVVNANGAPIAKGELLKIGELLAVRITEIQ
jgi:type III secretion system YscQ/HrcQ family protein